MSKKVYLIGGAILVLIVASISIMVLFKNNDLVNFLQRKSSEEIKDTNIISENNNIDNSVCKNLEEVPTDIIVEEEKPKVFSAEEWLKIVYKNGEKKLMTPSGLVHLSVDWNYADYSEKEISAKEFLDGYKSNYQDFENKFKESDGLFLDTLSDLGTINDSSDRYQGNHLYYFNLCHDMGCGEGGNSYFSGMLVRDVKSKTIYLLTRYSDKPKNDQGGDEFKIFAEDSTAYISEVENPEIIKLDNNLTLKRINAEFDPSGTSGWFEDSEFIIDFNNKNIYKTGVDSCFLIYNENGSRATYEMVTPFKLDDKAHLLNISFDDGSKNKSDYIGQDMGGCGTRGCARIQKIKSEELQKTGVFSNGDPVFEFIYDESKIEQNSLIQNYYIQTYFPEDKKQDLKTFMSDHSIVLWQTPLKDYYLVFSKMDYPPVVECGKPVIYLYPKNEIDIRVEVTPNGGFSKTEPVYPEGGWLVKADPQSNIYNYNDKEIYPYLFWEGKGIAYYRPKEGFLVKAEELDNFFDKTLARLGLVGKEIKDFKEYWVPKISETKKAYYFITFLPQADFEKIAPLKIEPKPDTIIRVFMDYQGLESPIKTTNPIIKKPERKGFTVVEWGGAKR